MILIPKSKICNFTKEELQEFLDTSSSYKEVLDIIGLSPIGNNYNTLNKFIKLYELSTEKIDEKRKLMFNNVSSKHNSNKYSTKEKLLSALNENTCTAKSSRLLKYLIDFRIKEYKCEKCGISEWNNLPITLELHHKDGNNKKNQLDNLEVLCPNCHSQTNNFRFKNKKQKEKVSQYDLCPVCNTNYKSLASEMCQECRNKEKEKNIPAKETVKDLIRNKPFTQIGEMFNVSDNAIRKWCKKYGLPYKASDIKALSNDEWKVL